MKFVRMDGEISLLYLICSIVIPPLFVINLVILLIQIIGRVVQSRREKKDKIKYDRFFSNSNEKKANENTIIISNDDKMDLFDNLTTIYIASLEGYSSILGAYLYAVQNDLLNRESLLEFINYLTALNNLFSNSDNLNQNDETGKINNSISLLKKYVA